MKFKETSLTVLIDALQLIARNKCNSFSANPYEWPSTVAYFALGGRIENGVRLDKVEDLVKKFGYTIE